MGYIRCPKCRCSDLYIIEDNSFNDKAALGGALLTGSLFGGYAFGKSRKSIYQCAKCGKTFAK